jgi:hypothetical protein
MNVGIARINRASIGQDQVGEHGVEYIVFVGVGAVQILKAFASE